MGYTGAPLRERRGASIRRCDRCGGSEPAPRSNQSSTLQADSDSSNAVIADGGRATDSPMKPITIPFTLGRPSANEPFGRRRCRRGQQPGKRPSCNCTNIALRINDAIDQGGQGLERLLFFNVEFVAIVHAAHSADYMPKAPLGVVARDPGAAHE
jgi:hypothetical protein